MVKKTYFKVSSFGIILGVLLMFSACKPVVESPPLVTSEPTLLTPGYLTPRPIGEEIQGRPWITDLCIVDLDQDGWLDVLFTEGRSNEVRWARQSSPGVYEETVVGDPVEGPVHVEAVDMDGDGDLDLLVAGMGIIFPNTQKIGAVVLMEQTKPGVFKNHTIAADVHRVTDVQAADLDGDGDLDLSVAQFGYDQGEVCWMENLGNWKFVTHGLHPYSGAIHAPIADFDGDGLPDIATVVSQEWEEIYLFHNQGGKVFTGKILYGSSNEDFGSSGIGIFDLNGNGRPDILYTNGDAFDYARPGPRPWHGVQWLENLGGNQFDLHRLGDFPGAYSPVAVDLDNDGDQDIVAVSGFNHWENPNATSLVCFENDGAENFALRPLAHTPTHLIVVEAADMDKDGRMELVTGSFHAYPPYKTIGRLTLWDHID